MQLRKYHLTAGDAMTADRGGRILQSEKTPRQREETDILHSCHEVHSRSRSYECLNFLTNGWDYLP